MTYDHAKAGDWALVVGLSRTRGILPRHLSNGQIVNVISDPIPNAWCQSGYANEISCDICNSAGRQHKVGTTRLIPLRGVNLRQREPRWECRTLLDAVYQIPCVADWEHDCLTQSEPSHSNESAHGKSGAKKSHDCHVAALCRNAHNDCDGNRKDRELARERHQRARDKTLLELFKRRLVTVSMGVVIRAIDPQVIQQALIRTNPLLRNFTRSRKTGHANGHSTESPSKTVPHPARRT
jgi:hypothetical protein